MPRASLPTEDSALSTIAAQAALGRALIALVKDSGLARPKKRVARRGKAKVKRAEREPRKPVATRPVRPVRRDDEPRRPVDRTDSDRD